MNRLWLALVLISSATALWFSGGAAMDLWRYSRLDSAAKAEILHLGVIQKTSSQYAIEAKYSFTAAGCSYSGRTVFSKPYFLNELSARSSLKDLEKKSWIAWYSQKDPSFSSLQKMFPFLSCIQAFLTVLVTLYFFFLRGFLHRLAF